MYGTTLTVLHAAHDRGSDLAATDLMYLVDPVGGQPYGISVEDFLGNLPASVVVEVDETILGDVTLTSTSATIFTVENASNADVFAVSTAGSAEAVTIGGGVNAKLVVSGNVGFGVTPEAWHGNFDAVQLGGVGAFRATHAAQAAAQLDVSTNAYYDSSDTRWEYIRGAGAAGDEAAKYYQVSGTHVWQVAGAGTADAAISWTTALTIANDGDVVGGATGPTWRINNETATATNPVFNPGGADTYGIGGTATTTTIVADGANRIEADGTGIGFFATTPASQVAHLADPTDLATCMTAISTLIDNLKTYGLMAADP